MNTSKHKMTNQFAKDVHEGLSAPQKFLSSRYFYDATGDKIFQQIMAMPEYYLTKCEFEIFNQQKDQILSAINPGSKFNLVELGAGDGYKTKILLDHFLKQEANFEYFPVDISGDVLKTLKTDLNDRFPKLKVTNLNYEYFEALERLNELDDSPKVILFLGSNIGNFTPERAQSFFEKLNKVMRPGDKLLSGIDLKKDPHTILEAYNDPAGITRSFNLNLLKRMNRELGANFVIEDWDHFPTYDPFTGECRSYLMSCKKQDVTIEATGHTYSFRDSEPVHMEISRKYRLDEIEDLAGKTGFEVSQHFTDSRDYFVDSLWNKV
ncbi:L-histidine N(alpha)-methyltransferase [Owenweeksia hongkongensis]|uniref:L-histidine N(alpha)-methyltransferase n=1 Tax=Owenweeksia hongkongensis TaxID=253245 RepID=UPI003A8FBF6E